MRVPCYCGAYLLDPENASYVKDGKPMCHAHTCLIYARRTEVALRRAPFFDETDNVPEPYAKSVYARSPDI